MKHFKIFLLSLYLTLIIANAFDKLTRGGLNYMQEAVYDYDFINSFNKLVYTIGLYYSITFYKHSVFSANINYSSSLKRRNYRISPLSEIQYNFPYDNTLSIVSSYSKTNFVSSPFTANYILISHGIKVKLNGRFIIRLIADQKDS